MEPAGWVYFIQSRAGGPVKVGFATDLDRRISELQVGSPILLRLLGAFAGSRQDEKAIHDRLESTRSHGEWFVPGPLLRAVLEERLAQVPETLLENVAVEVPEHVQKSSVPKDFNLEEAIRRATLKALGPAAARRQLAEWKKADERMEKRRCRKCGEVMGRAFGAHKAVCAARTITRAVTLAVLALALALPGLVSAQDAEFWCWNDKPAKVSAKDATYHTTPALKGGTGVHEPRLWQVGYSVENAIDWAPVIQFPISSNLRGREIVGADLEINARSVSGGDVIFNVKQFGPLGFNSALRDGSIRRLNFSALLAGMDTGPFVGFDILFEAEPGKKVVWLDPIAAVAQNALRLGSESVSLFLVPTNPLNRPSAQAVIRGATLKLYYCPARPARTAAARRNVAVVDEFDELDDAPEITISEFYRALLSWFDQNPQR